MTHFLAFLGPKSPKCGPVLLKFAPQLLPKESKTLFEEFFENSNFYRKRTFRKFALFFSFCPTLRLFFSMKEAEIEKTKYSSGQNYAIGLSKNRKVKALSCPIFHEKYDYFLSYFGPFLVKKRAWSHFKVSESNLLQSHNSGACSSQKSLVPELPSFAAIGVKGRFFQFQTTFSSLAAFLGTMPLL